MANGYYRKKLKMLRCAHCSLRSLCAHAMHMVTSLWSTHGSCGPAFAIVTNHHCDCSIRPSGAIEKHVKKSINALLTNYYLCLSLSPHGCLAGRPAPPPHPHPSRRAACGRAPPQKTKNTLRNAEKSPMPQPIVGSRAAEPWLTGARAVRGPGLRSLMPQLMCLAFFFTLLLSVCQPGSVSAGWGLIHTMRTMHWGANHMSTCHANASDT